MRSRSLLRLHAITAATLIPGVIAVASCSTSSSGSLPDPQADDGGGPLPDGAQGRVDGDATTDGGGNPSDASLGPCTQEGTGCGPTGSGNFNGICCGKKCVPLPDDNNCGGCGEKCQGGTTCFGNGYGQVTCGLVVQDCTQLHEDATASPTTLVVCKTAGGRYGVCCGSGCVSDANWASDPNNCGHCGVACPKGATCNGGKCQTGSGGGCANLQTPCPSGYTCNGLECVVTACAADTTDYVCNQTAGGYGVCCGTSCVKTGTCQ